MMERNNNKIVADYLVSRSEMSIDEMGWYVDPETNVPYLNPPFDKSWDMLIYAWHIFTTEQWNKGIDLSYIVADFNDCVVRNAPKTACEILANIIVEISKRQDVQEVDQDEKKYSEEEVIRLLISLNQEIHEIEDVRNWFYQNKTK
jgi:hypothetical protein